jgi:hypothetical protein
MQKQQQWKVLAEKQLTKVKRLQMSLSKSKSQMLTQSQRGKEGVDTPEVSQLKLQLEQANKEREVLIF